MPEWSIHSDSFAPLIVFASVLVGSLGIPVPTLAAVVYAGSLMAMRQDGAAYTAMVLAAGLAGTITGDVVWFWLGRHHGARILSLLCRLSLSPDTCMRRTADIFTRRGIQVLLLARFVPGLSVLCAPLAGASGIRLAKFLAYAEAGAAIWLCCCLAAGELLGDHVSALLTALRHFGMDLGGLAAVLALAYAAWSWSRRKLLARRLRMARIAVEELEAMIAADLAPPIVDARAAFQQNEDPFVIPGAWVLREDKPDRAVQAIPKLAPVVVYCACPNDVGAAVVARRMHKLGYVNVRPLAGGIDAWRAAGLPMEPISRRNAATAVASLAETAA